jgi:hypothetical protein
VMPGLVVRYWLSAVPASLRSSAVLMSNKSSAT